MDDNARAHRARITNRYLEQAAIVRLDWPARSPDLNPIEHAWESHFFSPESFLLARSSPGAQRGSH